MQIRNGIILLGGSGTRLYPPNAPAINNKHLVYLHGKLVVDYSLGTLQSLGCKNITVVLGGDHHSQVVAYLQDGSRYGMSLNYVFQGKPLGIAHAINLCRRYVADDPSFLVMLGDSFFDKPIAFNPILPDQAQIVLCKHPQLERFGVASVSKGIITKIEEKPKTLSCMEEQYAIAGCYLFDQSFFKFFECIKPSDRGEFEITDILQLYQSTYSLGHVIYDGVWSDVGTHQSLQDIQHLLYNRKEIQ